MSKWQRFAVELKGEDGPVVVETNGRDWASVPFDPNHLNAVSTMFQVVHHALLRAGASVPRDYDSFLDETLEGMPEPIDEGEPDALDPTGTER